MPLKWWSTRGGENKEEERIRALEKAVEGLESRIGLMRGEWEEVHDRVNRVMGRLNARIRKVGPTEAPESDDGNEPKGVLTPQTGVGSHATLARMRR